MKYIKGLQMKSRKSKLMIN